MPHVVTGLHRRDGRIVLTDQYGSSYPHPADAVIATAVPDPRVLTPATGAQGAGALIGHRRTWPTIAPGPN